MKILLTGANGFVGSHIAEELSARGHEVRCLVRPTSDRTWLKEVPVTYCTGDIRQADALKEALTGADAVVHAAGIVRAMSSDAYYAVNQKATIELARAALTYAPALKKFIFISSQAAMGPSDGPYPRRAGIPEAPVSDYGRSKLAAERELAALAGTLPCTILRPASVYGPRDKDILIFFSLVHRGLRPRTMKPRLLQMIFVKDVAKAVAQALTEDRATGKTYYLADGAPYSWETVAQSIAEVAGKKTLPLPLPDMIFKAAALAAEAGARFTGRPAVLNRQKIDEMLQPYWLGDPLPAAKELGVDFTNLKIGAKITYLWYIQNRWL